MESFEFLVPTKIIFGKDSESRVGAEIAARGYKKVLLHYGGTSAVKSGLIGKVRQSLKDAGISFVELSGVLPNPRVSLVREGISLCDHENIDMILAVGGGSVIDSAKAIGMGYYYDGDVWDLYSGAAVAEKTLPVAVILTIPAAGSESSPSSVITNHRLTLKKGCTNEITRPIFAILNPELTYTLPAYQTACGAADIMAHIMERYFTNTPDVCFTDRLGEAGLKTIIEMAPIAIAEPENLNARSNIMWCSSVAHNDLFGTGRSQDWGSHAIEHELSAIYDIAHGAGLAIVFPAWMRYVYKHDLDRFARFGKCVFGIEPDSNDPEATALKAIDALEAFFKSIGLPTRLSEAGIDESRIDEMAEKCTVNDTRNVGGFVPLKTTDVAAIYRLAL